MLAAVVGLGLTSGRPLANEKSLQPAATASTRKEGGVADALMQRVHAVKEGVFSVVMIGDSTVRRPFLALIPFLDTLRSTPRQAVDTVISKLRLMDLPHWDGSHADEYSPVVDVETQRARVGEVEVVVTVVYQQKALLDMAILGDVMHTLLEPQGAVPVPDVVLVGPSGMHHLTRFCCRSETSRDWSILNYEQRLRDALSAVQEACPDAALKAFTTHSVCNAKMDGHLDNGAGRERVLACAAGNTTGCFGPPRSQADEPYWEAMAADQLERFNASLWSSWGAENLVVRERAVLSEPAFSSRWEVVDGHSLTLGHCDETEDGDHYSERILEQELTLMLLPGAHGTDAS